MISHQAGVFERRQRSDSLIRVANAPCSWGVLEFESKAASPPYSRVLDEIAESGYRTSRPCQAGSLGNAVCGALGVGRSAGPACPFHRAAADSTADTSDASAEPAPSRAGREAVAGDARAHAATARAGGSAAAGHDASHGVRRDLRERSYACARRWWSSHTRAVASPHHGTTHHGGPGHSPRPAPRHRAGGDARPLSGEQSL
jgi:hypothetical protein